MEVKPTQLPILEAVAGKLHAITRSAQPAWAIPAVASLAILLAMAWPAATIALGLLVKPPPLIGGLTRETGQVDGCPPRFRGDDWPKATSPELEQRVARLFPTGGNSAALEQTLAAQRFTIGASCENDSSIHEASFVRYIPALTDPDLASIYWKTDANNRIVWTKSFIGEGHLDVQVLGFVLFGLIGVAPFFILASLIARDLQWIIGSAITFVIAITLYANLFPGFI